MGIDLDNYPFKDTKIEEKEAKHRNAPFSGSSNGDFSVRKSISKLVTNYVLLAFDIATRTTSLQLGNQANHRTKAKRKRHKWCPFCFLAD